MVTRIAGTFQRYAALVESPGWLSRWVLLKAIFVTVLLLALWGLQDKDAVVVYMRF